MNQIHWTTQPELSILPAEARCVAKPRPQGTGPFCNQPQISAPEVAVTKPVTLILQVSPSNFLLFTNLKKKKNRIKNPEAQIREKKQPEESKRQLVTISGTADEVTTDTEGKKMKT